MSVRSEPPRHGRWGRIGELGPAWITAIAALIVALTSAGFFAGRASAPAKETAAPASTPAVTSGAPQTPTPTVSPASTETASTLANGAQLGSYTIKLPTHNSVPLGPTAPTPSEYVYGGSGADLSAFFAELLPINGTKMLALPGGSTPTYRTCADDVVDVGNVATAAGAAFCLVETGRMAGVKVISVNSEPYYSVLHVTVWQHSTP